MSRDTIAYIDNDNNVLHKYMSTKIFYNSIVTHIFTESIFILPARNTLDHLLYLQHYSYSGPPAKKTLFPENSHVHAYDVTNTFRGGKRRGMSGLGRGIRECRVVLENYLDLVSETDSGCFTLIATPCHSKV